MVWSIDTDDFLGSNGGDSGSKYPLLRAINYALAKDKNISPPPEPVVPPSTIPKTVAGATSMSTCVTALLLMSACLVVL
jgi:hypothetical protein